MEAPSRASNSPPRAPVGADFGGLANGRAKVDGFSFLGPSPDAQRVAVGTLSLMTPAQARPLEPLEFRFRPLAPRALAWSCDAELAVALDDCIQILLPEFAPPDEDDQGENGAPTQSQFSLSLEASALLRPDPLINARLCRSAGLSLPASRPTGGSVFEGVGNGPVTGSGAALGQVVSIAWSPNGLGQNLRPVLAAMTTNGSIMTLGEDIEIGSSVAFSARSRSFRNWKILWGLGAQLPIPDASSQNGVRLMKDRICSFAWAKELYPGRALLAYANDCDEIVIMQVQFDSGQTTTSPQHEPAWSVAEVARFYGGGPHEVRHSSSAMVRIDHAADPPPTDPS